MTWRLKSGWKLPIEFFVCRSRTKASLDRDETRRPGCLWSRGLTKRADPIAAVPLAGWDVLGLY